MRILSIDPSPNCTGLVGWEDGRIAWWQYTTSTRKWAQSDHGIFVPKVKRADEIARLERIKTLRQIFKQSIKSWRPHYIGIEDYVWASQTGKGGGIIQMAEVGSALRLVCMESAAKCRTYDPGAVHLFWCGKITARPAGEIKRLMMEKSFEWIRSDLEMFVDGDRLLALYDESAASRKLFEAVSDAIAIAEFLATEIQIREGRVALSELSNWRQRALMREIKNKGSALDASYF